MKSEHHKARTQVARHNLMMAMRHVRSATDHLEDLSLRGTKAELLEAVGIWDKAVASAQEARQACLDLVGAEVEAWMKD